MRTGLNDLFRSFIKAFTYKNDFLSQFSFAMTTEHVSVNQLAGDDAYLPCCFGLTLALILPILLEGITKQLTDSSKLT